MKDTNNILRNSFTLDAQAEESYRLNAGEGIFRTPIGLDDPDDQ
jgi:hypothetical protein